jgi:transcriptional regulator with XRE-family HTH domain
MARPSKFNAEVKRQIKQMALKGWTDSEMAELLGVTEQTFNNWKKKHKPFFESLKDWKREADHKVVKSLYDRACGYAHQEDKIFNDNGEPLIVPTVKHYPPDTTAMIFWLKNRLPGEWRDKQEHVVESESFMTAVSQLLSSEAGADDKPSD